MAINYLKILDCLSANAAAAVGGPAIDCADLALQCLAQCCEAEGIKLTLEVYDAASNAYIRLNRTNYNTIDKYVADLKLKLGAISLFDQDKITKKKRVDDLVPGETVLYHLPGNTDYTGHTMIVTAHDASSKLVTVAEGHVGGGAPSEGIYTYTQLAEKFSTKPNSEFKGGRSWNWGSIIDSD